MRASVRGQRVCGCQRRWLPHSTAPLLSLWWISTFASAQAPPDTPSTFQTEPSAAETSSPSPSLNPTEASASSQPPQTQPQPSTTSQSDSTNSNDGLLNLYFLFIAILIVILLLGLWLLHRRKKRMKAQSRGRAQDALARDLNGWVGTRRWIHGNRRPAEEGPARHEEGLNEHGEAPPPYEPSPGNDHSTAATAPAAVDGAAHTDWSSNSAGVTVPLQTLSTDGRTAPKPPGYQETIRSASEGDIGPSPSAGASTTELTRPPAAQHPEH